jgi:nitroreductase
VDVFDAARTMLAVREYEDRPVPDDVIRRVVEAGRLSASSMNGQPWHFVVVTDREMLARIGREIKTGRYVAQAAFAIAVAAEAGSQFALSDASRANQSMMLTAWDAGVGSNWVGFGGMDRVRAILGIPDRYDVVAVLPFGYPAQVRTAGVKRRKPLSEVASRERFGQPFE